MFLIDENLSWRLVRLIEQEFPDCRHLSSCGLMTARDEDVWAYAKANGFVLLSKDDDMQELVERHGAPPKLVWLKLGNVSTSQIAQVMLSRANDIRDFLQSPSGQLLVLD
ncbi:MAG: hypothetical protein CME88_05035 [Hirschia sp.]|nr:hypothetical protein [Hirschia sp.]MBF17727.1 hypothetical protein [Hirschia sp.]|tara:strand:+ start:341 stop:670 length:330 start_codon:yes stop_codon:yes gene_type:complete